MGYGTPDMHGLWVTGYGYEIPANQLGKSKNVWVRREYGLCGVWVTGESTVAESTSPQH